MPTTPIAKIPYPSGGDAPAAAADMMAIVMSMDARIVLAATDAADRDQKYADAPASTLVVSGPSRKIWLKTGPGPTDWWTVYERVEYTTGFTSLANWQIDAAKAIRNTATSEVRVRVIRTGPDLTANTAGSIPDQEICVVPPEISANLDDFLVTGSFKSILTGGSGAIKTDGIVKLYDMHSSSRIANGEMVWFSAVWNN